jgi:hypothetical protein
MFGRPVCQTFLISHAFVIQSEWLLPLCTQRELSVAQSLCVVTWQQLLLWAATRGAVAHPATPCACLRALEQLAYHKSLARHPP